MPQRYGIYKEDERAKARFVGDEASIADVSTCNEPNKLRPRLHSTITNAVLVISNG